MREVDKYDNIFIHDPEHYQRDVDVFKHYIKDAATYLNLHTGVPLPECEEYVRNNLKPGGDFEFTDPKVMYLERQENGDREKKVTTLSRYIGAAVKKLSLIAPTFTTYINSSKLKSVLSKYIEGNINLRSVAKKAMFAAEAIKSLLLYAVKKIEQTGRKLGNNAISGAHVTASTPLFNKTAHSTLTSTCRSTSGYGNANNEKFLSGNRHYFNRDIVLNNIMSIINHFDETLFGETMNRHKLHYPTVEETMECIVYSTNLYWWDKDWMTSIAELVAKLSPIQRAAFVYIGDAFHLLKHNPEFMRTMLTNLSNKVSATHPDPIGVLKKVPGVYLNLAHQICFEESKGVEPGNYGKLKDSEEGLKKLNILACTAENIADTMYEYRDLIEAFWMTSNLPASVAHFPSSIRRSALTSDTDSTIFTVQDWIKWYSGKISFDERSRGIYAAVVFLTSSTIKHVLATMSANFGISKEHLFKISMKSEYSFDVFIPSQLGKHYFACISCQEGLVYEEMKYEIKGAQLKSANLPKHIVKDAEAMMKGIISQIIEKGSVSIQEWLTHVGTTELGIVHSIKNSDLTYFRSTSIKSSGSYAGEKEHSPYANHFLWNEVFGPKYGVMPEPPYETSKISVTTDTPSRVKAWLAEMKDRELANRFKTYMERTGKTTITTFNLPKEILQSRGIPSEVRDIIDYEKITIDLCRIYYILLETLGYYALGGKVKRLVSSEGWGYTPEQLLEMSIKNTPETTTV